MRFKSILFLFLFLMISTGAVLAASAETQLLAESIQEQLEELNLKQLLGFTELVEVDLQDFIPDLSLSHLLSGSSGTAGVMQFLNLLLKRFLREIYLSLHFIRQLIVITILSALLQRLDSTFGAKTVVNLAFAVCFLVLAYLCLQSFQAVLAVATESVDQMVSFMYSLLPTLSALLITVGGITSATIFHPLLWALVGAIAGLVHYLLFPLILFGTAFGLLAHFSPELPLAKLGGFFRQGVTTLLGAAFMVFTGFMVVRGAIAPVADGISLRAAKHLTKTLVPIAGGMFADALEVAVGGSLLIKNGVGVFGLVMVVFLVLTPLIKVWSLVLVYKLVAALLEPICDQRIVGALAAVESSLILVFVSLGTVALMFLVTISIVVGLGNLAVLMR
ncbi:MAG: stage III sporulation protein AE [Firmicutes bacterium]|mgnify:CR=1 FL=1|nr:stage III sporulation protein AE [Bacillota bacterium]